MSYKKHPIFLPPTDESIIWRYTNFIKFVDLVQRSSLYFSRADKLGDPFEGSYSKENIKQRSIIYKEIPRQSLEQISSFYEDLKRHTYLNCWHINNYESSAMWNLYSRFDEGIAIQSTFKKLIKSLTPSKEKIYIGKVNYVDYDTDLIPEGNVMYPYIYKRKSFEHEKELRAVIQRLPTEGRRLKLSKETPFGLYIKVNLKELINKIFISPLSPDWIYACVKNILKNYDLKINIVHSTLNEKPVY